jgi:hypothetical protein
VRVNTICRSAEDDERKDGLCDAHGEDEDAKFGHICRFNVLDLCYRENGKWRFRCQIFSGRILTLRKMFCFVKCVRFCRKARA